MKEKGLKTLNLQFIAAVSLFICLSLALPMPASSADGDASLGQTNTAGDLQKISEDPSVTDPLGRTTKSWLKVDKNTPFVAKAYSMLTSVMKGHVFWHQSAPIFKDLSNTLKVSSLFLNAVMFSRQIIYLPATNKWQVIDKFNMKLFFHLPNLLHVSDKLKDKIGDLMIEDDLYLFFKVGVMKDNYIISIREIDAGGKEAKEIDAAKSLFKAVTLAPIFRLSAKRPVRALKDVYQFLVKGFSVEYLTTGMWNNDTLVFPSTITTTATLGMAQYFPNLFMVLKGTYNNSFKSNFTIKLRRRYQRNRLTQEMENKLLLQVSFNSERGNSKSLDLGPPIQQGVTRELIVKGLKNATNSEYNDISKYVYGHVPSPEFEDFYALATKYHYGEISEDEYLAQLAPYLEEDRSLQVRLAQKLTMFPLIAINSYLKDLVRFTAGTNKASGKAMAAQYTIDIAKVESQDFLQKLFNLSGTSLFAQILTLKNKKKFEKLDGFMAEMDHILDRNYEAESDYEKESGILKLNALILKSSRTRSSRTDLVDFTDQDDFLTRYRVRTTRRAHKFDLAFSKKGDDMKSSFFTSVARFDTKNKNKVADVAMQLGTIFFEKKFGKDIIDSNPASDVNKPEELNYQHYLNLMFSPFINRELMEPVTFDNASKHKDIEIRTAVLINRAGIDRLIDADLDKVISSMNDKVCKIDFTTLDDFDPFVAPKLQHEPGDFLHKPERRRQLRILERRHNNCKAKRYLRKFAKRLKKVKKEKDPLLRYIDFENFFTKNTKKYKKTALLVNFLLTALGEDNVSNSAVAQYKITYKDPTREAGTKAKAETEIEFPTEEPAPSDDTPDTPDTPPVKPGVVVAEKLMGMDEDVAKPSRQLITTGTRIVNMLPK